MHTPIRSSYCRVQTRIKLNQAEQNLTVSVLTWLASISWSPPAVEWDETDIEPSARVPQSSSVNPMRKERKKEERENIFI